MNNSSILPTELFNGEYDKIFTVFISTVNQGMTLSEISASAENYEYPIRNTVIETAEIIKDTFDASKIDCEKLKSFADAFKINSTVPSEIYYERVLYIIRCLLSKKQIDEDEMISNLISDGRIERLYIYDEVFKSIVGIVYGELLTKCECRKYTVPEINDIIMECCEKYQNYSFFYNFLSFADFCAYTIKSKQSDEKSSRNISIVEYIIEITFTVKEYFDSAKKSYEYEDLIEICNTIWKAYNYSGEDITGFTKNFIKNNSDVIDMFLSLS